MNRPCVLFNLCLFSATALVVVDEGSATEVQHQRMHLKHNNPKGKLDEQPFSIPVRREKRGPTGTPLSESLIELPGPTSSIFCYALVRRNSSTIPFMSEHLRHACDDWSLYGSFSDSKYGVVEAYTAAEEKAAVEQQMREIMVGVWRDLTRRGYLEKYKWFVKVDDDSYVRPAMLARGLARYSQDKIVVPWQDTSDGDGENLNSDGYFIAVPQRLIKTIVRELFKGGCASYYSGKLSGHNGAGSPDAPQDNVDSDAVRTCKPLKFAKFLDEVGDSLVVGDACVDLERDLLEHDFEKVGPFCPDRSCQVGPRRCVSAKFAVAHGGFLKEPMGQRLLNEAFGKV